MREHYICPKCGGNNPFGAKFCGFCGAEVIELEEQEKPVVQPVLAVQSATTPVMPMMGEIQQPIQQNKDILMSKKYKIEAFIKVAVLAFLVIMFASFFIGGKLYARNTTIMDEGRMVPMRTFYQQEYENAKANMKAAKGNGLEKAQSGSEAYYSSQVKEYKACLRTLNMSNVDVFLAALEYKSAFNYNCGYYNRMVSQMTKEYKELGYEYNEYQVFIKPYEENRVLFLELSQDVGITAIIILYPLVFIIIFILTIDVVIKVLRKEYLSAITKTKILAVLSIVLNAMTFVAKGIYKNIFIKAVGTNVDIFDIDISVITYVVIVMYVLIFAGFVLLERKKGEIDFNLRKLEE